MRHQDNSKLVFVSLFFFVWIFSIDIQHLCFLSVSLALSLVVVPLYCFAFPLILYGLFFSIIVGGTQSKCLKNEKKNQATLISIITKENNFAVHIVCTRH